MSKLIVGCGYVGKRVARKWISQGDRVLALTRTEAGGEELRRLGIEPIFGDVSERGVLRGVESVERVLYAVGFDRRGGKTRREVTVEGVRNVLESLQSGGLVSGEGLGLMYVSTTSVYGVEDGSWVDAESRCVPEGENGRLAWEAEELVRQSGGERGGISGAILRLSGIYGRGRLLARQQGLREGEPLTGNPEGWLNLIHVEDAVGAILACEAKGEKGATYLVSDDRPIRRREYYSLLAKLSGAPEPSYQPTEEDLRNFNKRCDNRRTKERLGWEPRFATITEGLPDAIQAE